MANKTTGTKEPTTAQTNQQPPPASGPVVAPAALIQPPVVTPLAGDPPADSATKPPPVQPPVAKPPPADRSARAFDAVDYPVMACIGCASTNTVRIDEHLKKPFHRRRCRSCGKEFKEPGGR